MRVKDLLNSSNKNSNSVNYHLRECRDIELYEALKLLHDKENKLIAVASTETDPRKASKETYRNKEILKSAGFKWSNGRWVISDDQFEVAKKTLTTANKTEYLINKLEDVQEFINDTVKDSSKNELTQKIQGYIDDLANATDEAAASAEIRRYLEFFSGFHQYSFYNRILIYIQNPDATKVASYKNWQKKGRQVKKGAKALKIAVPIFPKSKNSSADEDEDDSKTQPIRYIVGNVFDISDTEAVTPEGEVPDEPQWWGDNEPSETADKLYDLVLSAAASEGIDVTNEEARHGEKGYSEGGHINITSDVAGVGRVSTMIHEYAHELMHWEDQSKFYVGKEIARNRQLAELQAESVSYVVLRHYKLPCQHHTTYLALWKANKDRVRQNVESISKVAHHIIGQIEKQAAKSTEKL